MDEGIAGEISQGCINFFTFFSCVYSVIKILISAFFMTKSNPSILVVLKGKHSDKPK